MGDSAASRVGVPPVDLLGLGPGLTPSGDDLLCGMLVALHAVGQAGMAPELYAALPRRRRRRRRRSPPRSCAPRPRGWAARPCTRPSLRSSRDRPRLVADRVEALGRIGHTSGWDALAGAMLVLQAFGTTEGSPPESHGRWICE